MSAMFATRDDLRSKLRDLLVDEVRRGVVDGDRAKSIAEDIIDELELSPEDETPLAIFERLAARYPDELAALKAKVDKAQGELQDQVLARQMAELIALGNFDGALAVSRGKALEAVVADAAAAAAAEPVPPPAPAVPAPEVALPVDAVQAAPSVPVVPAAARTGLSRLLRTAASMLARAADRIELPKSGDAS